MKRCDLCGDRGSDGDPVVEYMVEDGIGHAHIGCAEDEGWED